MCSEPFPVATDRTDNPAIQLFGNRLFSDQSATEFLAELLLTTISPKRIAGTEFAAPLPLIETLTNWPTDHPLQYAPKARLNLKLFAFMGASRLDSRHVTHRQHYKELLEKLRANVRVVEGSNKDDVLRTIENLFLGFQGAGAGRTWCAQSFLPVCHGLIAGETIWNETAARRTPPEHWDDLLDDLRTYFAGNKHLFLARGGEVLYLQVCNALRQKRETVQRWVKDSGVQIEPEEQNPAWLHEALQRELGQVLHHCPRMVTDIAEFIDSGVEPDTATATDSTDGEMRYLTAGWCPAESWQEGYLFAVDLLRLCMADLDVIDRLQLMETACAMQVLRSLATQSARHCPLEGQVGWPGYRLAVSSPDESSSAVKRISRHTAKVVEKLIYHAVRSDSVQLPSDEAKRDKCLKEADRSYAGKLFVSLAKRIGLLVPRRGGWVRFTLNERLLRLLVVTTVPVGGRLTYDRFKELVEARHGLVFDADGFARAGIWADGSGERFVGHDLDSWLQDMLKAAGLLVNLSDSCALIEHPVGKKGGGQ